MSANDAPLANHTKAMKETHREENTTITLDRPRKKAYEALLEYYFKVAPALNEPLYT